MKRIIAICGAKRSGKDVLASHIVNKYGYTRLSFAEPLKHIVKLLFDFNDQQVGLIEGSNDEKDTLDERWGISPRKALQFVGTEILQNKIQELLKLAEEENSKVEMNDQTKYLIDQKIEVLRSIN